MHEIVKVQLEQSYPYSDFEGWYRSLDDVDKDFWVQMAKDASRTESNAELLAKKAMELYCLEMGIDYIPNSEDYLEKIFRRLITNINLASMCERNLIEIKTGKLSFITDAKFDFTEKGKNYLKKLS